jgi:hypothetical protein
MKESLKNINGELQLNELIQRIYQTISDYVESYFTCDLQTIKEIGSYEYKYNDNKSQLF